MFTGYLLDLLIVTYKLVMHYVVINRVLRRLFLSREVEGLGILKNTKTRINRKDQQINKILAIQGLVGIIEVSSM